MKLKKLLLPLLAAVLVLSAAIPSAMAYFTTYTRAKGGYTIRLSRTTTVTEEYGDWQKSVTIQNTEGGAVFVRAKGFVGTESGIALNYSGEGWSAGDDGWYYYYPAVIAGASSKPLLVSISNYPKALDAGDNFNVIVVYESTPAKYNADGSPDPDWTMTLDTGVTG